MSAVDCPSPSAVSLQVVEVHSGVPVSGASVVVNHDFDDLMIATDNDGMCRIELLGETPLDFVDIRLSAEGYVPMRQRWERHGGRLELPEFFTFSVSRGSTVGGTVVDEDGTPIANVTVKLTIRDSPANPEIDVREHAVTTDEAGCWQCGIMPAEIRRLFIGLEHAGFTRQYTSVWATSTPSIADCRAKDAVFTLKKGATVSGRVLTAAGEPVAGATIGAGPFRMGFVEPGGATDEDGRFELEIEPDDINVMVLADHLAAHTVRIPKEALGRPVEVRLEAGRILRGRVVDPAGRPIAGAEVSTWKWGLRPSKWAIRTDADGRFLWDGAPDGATDYDIAKPGHGAIQRQPLQPSESEHVIILPNELLIRGIATDAETGLPLPSFTVTPEYDQGEGRPPHWYPTDRVRGTDGRFTMTFAHPHSGVVLLVEAEGHRPERTRLVRYHEGSIAIECALRAGDDVVGAVRRADGTAVAGAEVHLTRRSRHRIGRDCLGDPLATTDNDGRFRLSPQPEPFALAILNEDGYALAGGDVVVRGDPIVFHPWGRVEGRFVRDGQPVACENVTCEVVTEWSHRPGFTFNWTTYIDEDADGCFVFDRVPAGRGEVRQDVRQRHAGLTVTQREQFEANPGETVRLQLGGRGRTVIGRIAPPVGADPGRAWNWGGCRLRTPGKEKPFPEDYASMTDQKQRSWWHAWQRTDEAAAFYEQQFREVIDYHVELDADGRFSLADVAPGEYRLLAEIVNAEVEFHDVFGEPIGRLERAVTVPQAQSGDDAPIDLGTMALERVRLVASGEAPEFECVTLDGAVWRLSDHRGRYVLLDFWATWCSACVDEMVHVARVHERLGNTGRLEIIGLSLDQGIAAPRAFVRRHGYGWTQGLLGKAMESRVVDRYGVSGIPCVVLIDPKGRVIARDLRSDEIMNAITKALEGE